jgi:hypothetical protein
MAEGNKTRKKMNFLVVTSVPEIPCETVDVPESLSKNTVTTLSSEMRCGVLQCRAIGTHLATDRFFGPRKQRPVRLPIPVMTK